MARNLNIVHRHRLLRAVLEEGSQRAIHEAVNIHVAVDIQRNLRVVDIDIHLGIVEEVGHIGNQDIAHIININRGFE